MKPKRLVLVSYGIWGLSIVVDYLYMWLGDVEANLVQGWPLIVNPGSISLVIGFVFGVLTMHYLSALGEAESSDFSWLAAMLIISLFLGFVYWAGAGWVIRVAVGFLVILALEYHWPNWIWEIRKRIRRKSV